jgi:hypothetical protein
MRGHGRSSDLTIIIVVGVLLAIITTVSVVIAPVDNAPRVPGSSYSSQPDGTRAAYLVLRELGHNVVRSFEPIASLRPDPARTLLILANPYEKASAGDRRALRSFVEAGGVVLAYGPSAYSFLPGIAGRPSGGESMQSFRAVLPGALTAGAAEIAARAIPSGGLAANYIPVYASERDAAVLTAGFGEGRVIWCVDETPIQNDGVKAANNVMLLANAAGPAGARTILWDEHYHGERRTLWSYVAATPLPWAGAQIAIVALAVLANVSRRHGPVRPRTRDARVSPVEFIDTIAALYDRAGDPDAAVESARTRMLRLLARTSRLPASTSEEDLIAAAPFRSSEERRRASQALAAAAVVLRRGASSTREAVHIVGELQDLASVVTTARVGFDRGEPRRLDRS